MKSAFLDNPAAYTRAPRTMQTSTDYACAITQTPQHFYIAKAIWFAAVLGGVAVFAVLLI
jgi:hypothetical protein